MSPLAATARSIGPLKDGPPAGDPLRDNVVRVPVTGSTRITPPLPCGKADRSAIRMLPSASTATPLGVEKSGPPAGVVLLEMRVRTPVVLSTRITPGGVTPTMACSATSRSPLASDVIPQGVSNSGVPTGLLFSDRLFLAPSALLT